jgi:arylsulfatase
VFGFGEGNTVARLSLVSDEKVSGHPNVLIVWGDDVGMWNISAYHRGMMGGSTPQYRPYCE